MAELKGVSSKTKTGKEKRVSVEEIENGYLVVQNIEWKETMKDGHTEWKYDTKRWFSKTNPLKEVDVPLADLID